MEYKGDYNLDGFLEQGGATDDLAVAEYVIQDVFHGLLAINLRGGSFGCSTISARTPEGDVVFGRNFDWGTCTALIVRTNPAEGYKSVSTVNMDFLNLGLDMPEERQIRLLSVAAPFAPMDGMNEKGLCVAVLMIQDRPGFQQNTGKPNLTTTTAVRLLLDKAADVEEAVELLSQYYMHASAGMMVHFALADSAGHSVIVVYIDNEMVITETPVVTNYYLSPGEKYGIGTEESRIRYAILEDMLRNGSLFRMDEIRDALDGVSKHNFDSEFASTEWSIVYNQSTGEARYYHRENYEKYYSFTGISITQRVGEDKSLRKESKVMQTKKQSWLFCNCPFVCISFDFSWLNKARPGSHYIWTFNPPGLLTKYTAYGHMSTGS